MSAWLHDWLHRTWYGAPARGRWLQPLAWLFAAAAALRRAAYRRGWLGRYRSPRPVIVVGNLTVGGTGKTPFVAWIAQQLGTRGLRVGIASRGYGGAGGVARRLTPEDSAATAGDEALLLARKLGRPVAVGARRRDAVRLLEQDCDVVLCDDGLQHYALERDIEIAVVDGARALGNGRLLPAGPLREPAGRLAEMNAVVVNGPGFDWPGACRMELAPVAVVALVGGERRSLASFAGRTVNAIAAIGHPERFFALLRSNGLQLRTRALPDHQSFSPREAGVGQGSAVLMTEKDAVKCTGDGWQDAWYVEIEARVTGDAVRPLFDRIEAAMAARQRESVHRD